MQYAEIILSWRDGIHVKVHMPEDNESNSSSRAMALGSTQPQTETSTRTLPGGKERPARKPDNLTAICELIV
jgi:hypothetical protein